jgi:hypothetical protein
MTKSVKQALSEVLTEMAAMSPEELRADLDKHKNGSFAVAMREASAFIFNHQGDNVLDAPIILTPGFLPEHTRMFNTLWNELAWLDVAGPRLEYYVNDFGVPYTYGQGAGVRTYEPQPEHPVIREIRTALEAHTGTKFEVCFLNGYRDGSDQLGWHADDSEEMDDDRPIAIISLGAKREIYFRKKPGQYCPDCFGSIGEIHDPHFCNRGEDIVIEKPHTEYYSMGGDNHEKVWLESGSLCLMKPGMQDTHQHRIPKASYICGPRISLTFRGYVEAKPATTKTEYNAGMEKKIKQLGGWHEGDMLRFYTPSDLHKFEAWLNGYMELNPDPHSLPE